MNVRTVAPEIPILHAIDSSIRADSIHSATIKWMIHLCAPTSDIPPNCTKYFIRHKRKYNVLAGTESIPFQLCTLPACLLRWL